MGTEGATFVAPLIEKISQIVTAFTIGNVDGTNPQCKISLPKLIQITTSVSRITKAREETHHELPANPWQCVYSSATVA